MEHEGRTERIINLRSGPRRVRLDRKAAKRRFKSKKQEKPCETLKTLNTAERVFGIEELCEMILSNLPIRDVLVTRRVSKAFEHAIQGSQDLMRQAFLLPMDPSDTKIVKLNDMMFSKSGQCPFTAGMLPRSEWLNITGFRTVSIVEMRRQLRREDMVGKMFMTQPPISTVHVKLKQQGPYGCSWDIAKVEVLSGVTAGDVVRATSRLREDIGDRVKCITLGLDHGFEVESENQGITWEQQWQFYDESRVFACT